ncbi:MAG: hypothetical protein NC910_02785 [Candidatus Omnitrophica bacterium]|nr:hypothetical protein [Candidatus Omnitrophota bacterium]MCM8811958.1 hypothetical protein [Candidatus Omnitrophota bacterium]
MRQPLVELSTRQVWPSDLRPLAKQGVAVTISPQGRMRVLHEGKELAYRPIPIQPKAKPESFIWTISRFFPQMARKPAADHPWRKKMCV